jgi:hypothetical protein
MDRKRSLALFGRDARMLFDAQLRVLPRCTREDIVMTRVKGFATVVRSCA